MLNALSSVTKPSSIINKLVNASACYPSSSKITARCFNSHRASIARICRETYTRLYPTLLVYPDGSTITIRYHVPQKMIKLPIDVSKLSEEELKAQLERRRPKEKIVIEEEIEDDFNQSDYSHLWKEKR